MVLVKKKLFGHQTLLCYFLLLIVTTSKLVYKEIYIDIILEKTVSLI